MLANNQRSKGDRKNQGQSKESLLFNTQSGWESLAVKKSEQEFEWGEAMERHKSILGEETSGRKEVATLAGKQQGG